MAGFNIQSLFMLCLGLGIGFIVNGSNCHCHCDCISAGSPEPATRESALFLADPSPSRSSPLSNDGGSVYAGGGHLDDPDRSIAHTDTVIHLGDPDRLIAHTDTIMGRINASLQVMAKSDCGAGFSDAVPLLSMADMAQVDVVLESGTAGGRSAEFMSNFFRGTHVQIVTVDSGLAIHGGRCAGMVKDTHARLKDRENIRFLIGDSFKIFPKLIKEFEGKRIGLFIDGPKEMGGLRLCMQSLKRSTDVKFCAFHDVRPASPASCQKDGGSDAYNYMSKWTRSVLRSCCYDPWLNHYNIARCASSVGIVAGRDTYPLGVPGDF